MKNRRPDCGIFLPSLAGGGAERVYLNLASGLIDRGFSVDLVLANMEGELSNCIPHSVRVINFNKKRAIKTVGDLRNYLYEENPKTLLTALDHANLTAIFAKQLCPKNDTRIVISIHDAYIKDKPNLKLRAKVIPFLCKKLYNNPDAIIAVSDGVADSINKRIGIAREKINVLYNPVISSNVRHTFSKPDHPFFKECEKKPIFVGIGRLSAQKNFELLINSFKLILKDWSAKLIILGEGEERGRLEKIIKANKLEECVSLPGFVNNAYDYLSHSDVFVLSSRWEGLPTVLIEALAMGIPIVSTDCPSGPREILLDGKIGKLVQVFEPKQMSNAMSETIANLTEEKNKAKSHIYHANRFTFERALDAYVDVLFSERTDLIKTHVHNIQAN